MVVASCKCGKPIKAKAEYAGKRIKCPSCGESLRLPSPNGSSKKKVEPLADLLDEIGFEIAESRHSCPECKVRLTPQAVLCVQCGFHLGKGKRLTTKRIERRE